VQNERVIYLVDDDAAVRDSLAVLLSFEGFIVREFAEGRSFLETALKETPHCVILDVNMPGKSGIEILGDLDANHYPAPIFIISGQGDIPMAVQAIKNGAFDFFEKPFNADTVIQRVRESIDIYEKRQSGAAAAPAFAGQDLSTPREREVLQQIAAGASNKEAGRALSISPRTIEVHRARIMEKLGARNAADLVRIVLTGELQ